MRTVTAVGTRPKHPHDRRNTFLHPYLRHALGYSTTSWEESLTVKFRDLPSREKRLYTLTLGYGLREDKGGPSSRDHRQPQMSRGHAITLMARLHEMLLYGERTVQGVFEALGAETSNIDLGQYLAALEHMSARSGTAIPTGAAEQTLAYLYRHGKEVWPFLTHQLAITDQDTPADTTASTPALDGSEGGDISPAEGDKSGTSASRADEKRREKKGGVGRQELAKDTAHEDSISSNTRASFSLARLSTALETFVRARMEKGAAPKNFPFQELTNFLYLGGQTKVTVEGLKALADKYGHWALDRARREARADKAKLTEAVKSAEAGRAFALSKQQLDAAVDFLDPNKDGNIDLEELMQALKQERSALTTLSKDERRKNVRQGATSDETEPVNKASPADAETSGVETEERVVVEQRAASEEDRHGTVEGAMKAAEVQEVTLFSPEEAGSLTAYLVESQQAFSLINVADIQHGMRSAKRAGAQVAARNTCRRAANRFATQLRTAGMVLDSAEGWEKWFDICELGLRAGGAVGAKQLVGRTELKRGLKALSAGQNKVAADDEGENGAASSVPRPGEGWSEHDVDDLLQGLVILTDGDREDVDGTDGGGRNETRKDATDLTEEDFRERMMLAIADGGSKADRVVAAGQSMVHLIEKLENNMLEFSHGGLPSAASVTGRLVNAASAANETYLKGKGMRMGSLFERMVTWAAAASEEDLAQTPDGENTLSASTPTSSTGAQRGDESCVPPAALRATLLSLRTGGLTGAERAKIKADQRLMVKEAEEQRAAEMMTAEAARIIADAEKSGASAVLDLLRASIASKSIRVIELFNSMDTSKDGLISRDELKEGLRVIAEGTASGASSWEQMHKQCREKRQSAADIRREEKEKRGAIKLRARILAAESSGATNVIRRIHEHLIQTGLKVVDIFHSFSLRGNTSYLTTVELEMALSLVDGLDLTRREVRSVVRFLDKDESGTIDVKEVDEAIREFRELSRDLPSLGAGPMTIVDSVELGRFAECSFSNMLVSRRKKARLSKNVPDAVSEKGVGGSALQGSSAACKTQLDGADDEEFLAYAERGVRSEDESDHGGGWDEGSAKGDTVSVSEIAEAFEKAFRQFTADGGTEDSLGGWRRPKTQFRSTDTEHAQECVNKFMEWLRSSRTFDRTPTGRVPTLAEQMTERQKMELALQNKLQEKRRRKAGQRHWEQWVSRKAQPCKRDRRATDGDTAAGDVGGGGDRPGGTDLGARRRQQEEAEVERRKKMQEEAFAAWVREKDKLFRSRKKEKRRTTTPGGTNILESNNSKRRELRCTTPNRLPRLGGRADNASLAPGMRTTSGSLTNSAGSLATSGTKGSKRRRVPSKAERKALDLAATRVAVSPYRVRPHEQYQQVKHVQGGEILARMARDPPGAFQKALVKEGWQATTVLLGSATMAQIDPTFNQDGRKENSDNGCGDARGVPMGEKSVGSKTVGRVRRQKNGRRRPRPPGALIPRPVAPNPDMYGSLSDFESSKAEKGVEARLMGLEAGGRDMEEGEASPDPVARENLNRGSRDVSPRTGDREEGESYQEQPSPPRTQPNGVSESESGSQVANTNGSSSVLEQAQHAAGGVGGKIGQGSPPARDAAGARPDGRRGNSRGAAEGGGGVRGGDGGRDGGKGGNVVAGEFQRLDEGGGGSSTDMEFRVQNQALPDWADTIKDLPIDEPYEQREDDFEPDEEGKEDSSVA